MSSTYIYFYSTVGGRDHKAIGCFCGLTELDRGGMHPCQDKQSGSTPCELLAMTLDSESPLNYVIALKHMFEISAKLKRRQLISSLLLIDDQAQAPQTKHCLSPSLEPLVMNRRNAPCRGAPTAISAGRRREGSKFTGSGCSSTGVWWKGWKVCCRLLSEPLPDL